MLQDLKWIWVPFSRRHEQQFLDYVAEKYPPEGPADWIAGTYKPMSFVAEATNRIAGRASSLLFIASAPFSIAGYLFTKDDPTPLSYAIFALMFIAIGSLFRCVLISWVDYVRLSDAEAAFEYFAHVMFARARSLYVGTISVFLVIMLLVGKVIEDALRYG
jgi:hypothetical protein